MLLKCWENNLNFGCKVKYQNIFTVSVEYTHVSSDWPYSAKGGFICFLLVKK